MERAEIDIRQILLSIQRQSLLALGVAFIFIAIAATHLFLTKPLYTATALVLFDPSDKNLLDPTSSSDAGGEASARIDSEVEFIRSDAVLLETIRRTPIGAMLADTPAPAGLAQRALATLGLVSHTKPSTAEALHSALTKMRRSTTVKRRGETFIIAITAHSASPERAATVANSLAETYIAAQLRHKISNLENHRAILARHLEDAKIDIADAAAERDRSFDMSHPLPAQQTDQAAFHRPMVGPGIVESQHELLRNADVATAQY
ncbi:Wzz/FepE/Etk N-terminal domain-containing protein [Devosia sp. MC1541]|uniref:Wzz/FepE/Etk N-terminal domain-containing protein n=1 Tax=Devosia sp. MC1541 TaxID=2725264 RepID=UPI00145ED280|nr:Wzz/FepE/Etk N-terminal domain-containing protein [Devosia sp. MC1541]